MNDYYKYINGKVIVTDDKGIEKQVEPCDNLDEILIQENIIERLENEIKEGQNKNNANLEKIKDKKIISNFYLIPPLFILTVSLIISIIGITIPATPFTLMAYILVGFTMLVGIDFRLDINKLKSYIESENIKIEYINEQIEKEKEKLNELVKDKTCNKKISNSIFSKQVYDLDKFSLLLAKIRIYCDLVKNKKEYSKLYENGQLNKYVHKHVKEDFYYFFDNFEAIDQVIEEKGPVLFKSKKGDK